MLGESENQFSLTRAALSTCGRAKSKFLSVGAVALLLLLPVACWAGGVVTNCTESALRAAMAGGGTVRFACDGTITLASAITIGVNVTLDGTGHQVTISGSSSGSSFVRIFCINSNVNLTLINLTIMGGGGWGTMGGGILNSGGTLNAIGVAFTQNEVSVVGPGECFGGAIYNDQLGTLNLEGCSFTMNGAHAVGSYGVAFGGAIYNGGTMNASACMFDDNRKGQTVDWNSRCAHGRSARAGLCWCCPRLSLGGLAVEFSRVVLAELSVHPFRHLLPELLTAQAPATANVASRRLR